MTKVAVVGCGHWGKNLVRNFSELGALSAISDPNEALSGQFSADYDVPALEFDAVLGSDCNGVVIAAPAPLHAPLAQKAFAAGKHVYVEKPLAMTLQEADGMIEAGRKAERHLMVGHLLQYHPVFARLREMVSKGVLGDISYIYSNRLSFGKVRSEEDVIWSFAPHDISMILSLTNQNVNAVKCAAADILQDSISDTATIHMMFDGGLKSHVSCSWIHPYKEQKLVVIGSQGMAVFDDTREWAEKLAVYEHKIALDKSPPLLTKAEVRYDVVPQAEPLKAECQHFLDIVAGHADPLTDGDEGRRVLQVLTAASASLESIKTVSL
jgi:predicted dehydrogenase